MYKILCKNLLKVLFYVILGTVLLHVNLELWVDALIFLVLITVAYFVLLKVFPMVFTTEQVKKLNIKGEKTSAKVGAFCSISGMIISLAFWLVYTYLL